MYLYEVYDFSVNRQESCLLQYDQVIELNASS